jgi:hypothetical protein
MRILQITSVKVAILVAILVLVQDSMNVSVALALKIDICPMVIALVVMDFTVMELICNVKLAIILVRNVLDQMLLTVRNAVIQATVH